MLEYKPKKNYFQIGQDFELKPVDKQNKKQKINLKKRNLVFKPDIGFYLITPLLIGVILGIILDNYFKTKPAFILLFIFFGFIGTLYNLWKLLKE